MNQGVLSELSPTKLLFQGRFASTAFALQSLLVHLVANGGTKSTRQKQTRRGTFCHLVQSGVGNVLCWLPAGGRRAEYQNLAGPANGGCSKRESQIWRDSAGKQKALTLRISRLWCGGKEGVTGRGGAVAEQNGYSAPWWLCMCSCCNAVVWKPVAG